MAFQEDETRGGGAGRLTGKGCTMGSVERSELVLLSSGRNPSGSALETIMQSAVASYQERRSASLWYSISDKLWEELDWHIKEASYLNGPKPRISHVWARTLRRQGAINRLLLHSERLLADCIAFVGESFARELPGARRAEFLEQFNDWARLRRTIDAGWELNRPQSAVSPLLSRLKKRQMKINRRMAEAARILEEKGREIRLNMRSPNHADWEAFSWHVKELRHLLDRRGRSGSLTHRLSFDQGEFNRLCAVGLAALSALLKPEHANAVREAGSENKLGEAEPLA